MVSSFQTKFQSKLSWQKIYQEFHQHALIKPSTTQNMASWRKIWASGIVSLRATIWDRDWWKLKIGPFANFMLITFDFDRQYDLSKARKVGFREEIDTVDGYKIVRMERMRQAKILPWKKINRRHHLWHSRLSSRSTGIWKLGFVPCIFGSCYLVELGIS